jgi:anaerobic ribonucleoside-triphosphate reductase
MQDKNVKRTICQVFSRCCGWYVSKSAGNPGKQAEYQDRVEFIVEKKIKK